MQGLEAPIWISMESGFIDEKKICKHAFVPINVDVWQYFLWNYHVKQFIIYDRKITWSLNKFWVTWIDPQMCFYVSQKRLIMIQVCWIGCAVVTWSSGVSCRYNGGGTDHFSWRRTYRDVDGALLYGRGLLSRWSCLNVNRLLSMWRLLHRRLLCILAAEKKKIIPGVTSLIFGLQLIAN